jgi:ATP-dependent Clp protease ATP-binding subunit ClpA
MGGMNWQHIVIFAIAMSLFGILIKEIFYSFSLDLLLGIVALSCLGICMRNYFINRNRWDDQRRDQYLRSIAISEHVDWMCENLMAHDSIIKNIALRLEHNFRVARKDKPLGLYLLNGPAGCGKSFLCQLFQKALFENSQLVEISLEKTASLSEIQLPFHSEDLRPRVLVFNNIDRASLDIQKSLAQSLSNGFFEIKNDKIPLSNFVIFITAQTGWEMLNLMPQSNGKLKESWRSRAMDMLASNGYYDASLLSSIDEIYNFHKLNSKELAHITLQSTLLFASRYGCEISYVAPELIIEVLQKADAFKGFGAHRIQKAVIDVFEAPLAKASELSYRHVRIYKKDGFLKIAPERFENEKAA